MASTAAPTTKTVDVADDTMQIVDVVEDDVQIAEDGTDEGANQKMYYCQRCLNHNLYCNRKGHKPNCKYLNCNCDLCKMVEERRQLNNMLSARRLPPIATSNELESDEVDEKENGKARKLRDPMCSRCRAHGKRNPLRGHKKVQCPYSACTCAKCGLVETRRVLMARQIRLRRGQQRLRDEMSGKAPVKVPRAKKASRAASTTSSSASTSEQDTSVKEAVADAAQRASSVDSDGISRTSLDSEDYIVTSPSAIAEVPSLVQPKPIMPQPLYPVLPTQFQQVPIMPILQPQPHPHHNMQLFNFYMANTSTMMPTILTLPPQPMIAQPSLQEQIQQLQAAQLFKSLLQYPPNMYQ